MKFQTGRVKTIIALDMGRPYSLVCLNKEENDYGLYVRWFENDFGTPLALRGTKEEIETFLERF